MPTPWPAVAGVLVVAFCATVMASLLLLRIMSPAADAVIAAAQERERTHSTATPAQKPPVASARR